MRNKQDEINRIKCFIDATRARIEHLNIKYKITRAEQFEYDMCLFDLRVAEKELRQLEQKETK